MGSRSIHSQNWSTMRGHLVTLLSISYNFRLICICLEGKIPDPGWNPATHTSGSLGFTSYTSSRSCTKASCPPKLAEWIGWKPFCMALKEGVQMKQVANTYCEILHHFRIRFHMEVTNQHHHSIFMPLLGSTVDWLQPILVPWKLYMFWRDSPLSRTSS